VAHANPFKVVKCTKVAKPGYPLDPNAAHGSTEGVRSGQSEFYPDSRLPASGQCSHDAEHLSPASSEAGKLKSAICVPIKARAKSDNHHRFSGVGAAFYSDRSGIGEDRSP